jgi:hypothetical protein
VKTVFSAEMIGLSPQEQRQARAAGTLRDDRRRARPRLCELTGLFGRGFTRRELRPKQDWSEANSRGTRGVRLYWTLTTGPVYEAVYRTGWESPHTTRYLYVTADGDLHDTTKEEVRSWLSHLRPAPGR